MQLCSDLKNKWHNILLAIPYFFAILVVFVFLYLIYRFIAMGDKFLELIFGSGFTGAAAIIGVFYNKATKEKAKIDNDTKLSENNLLNHLLKDCVLKEPSEKRETARKILKDSHFVGRAWGYEKDGSTYTVYTTPSGGELWRE